jgi:hypothetical protein
MEKGGIHSQVSEDHIILFSLPLFYINLWLQFSG